MPTRLQSRGLARCAAVLALALASCATTTEQARVAPASGFLGNYSELEPGRDGQPLLLYISPEADFSRYSQILIDPVSVWREGQSNLAKLPPEDAQHLAHYLATALARELGREFEVVKSPGPDALRFRAAITEARGSRVVLDLASTVLPPARVLSEVKRLATGTHAFVGRAGLELEVSDSTTGERLIAAVDERSGRKTPRGAGSTWSDVEESYDLWARIVASRLALFRALDSQQ